MPGRNAKPIDLHIIDGKKHFTKKEIAERKASQIYIGNSSFKKPEELKGREHAERKWIEVVKIYKDAGINFVSSSDIGIISRYCLTYQEYLDAQKILSLLSGDPVSVFLDPDVYIKLQNNVNKKNDILTKLEDRLFLNPLAKIKTVPPKEVKNPVPTELERKGFGNL